MSTQSVIGCLFQAFMVGLVFAKLAKPQTRYISISEAPKDNYLLELIDIMQLSPLRVTLNPFKFL